jgi:ankyrin repeat protein
MGGAASQAIELAASGDTAKLTSLVTKNPGGVSKAREDFDTSALHHAAGGGHAEIVTLLVERVPGLAILYDSMGNSALHYAAEYGNDATMAILLQVPCVNEDLLVSLDKRKSLR